MSSWDQFFYDILNEATWAHQQIEANKIEDAKALVDSIVDKIIAFDPNNSDRMVDDLARKTASALLAAIRSPWFTARKKIKLLYYMMG